MPYPFNKKNNPDEEISLEDALSDIWGELNWIVGEMTKLLDRIKALEKRNDG